jgi:hypothetical protein
LLEVTKEVVEQEATVELEASVDRLEMAGREGQEEVVVMVELVIKVMVRMVSLVLLVHQVLLVLLGILVLVAEVVVALQEVMVPEGKMD